jgi:hypothetical protein
MTDILVTEAERPIVVVNGDSVVIEAVVGPPGSTGDTGPQGDPGEAGVAGDDGADGQGFTWMGEWSSVTEYVAYDLVESNGDTYIAITTNTDSEPPSADWDLFVVGGAVGATGPAGDTGVQGLQGEQGDTGASGVNFVWHHTWADDVTYDANDAVYYDGSSYVCILEALDKQPDVETTYWELFVAKGQGVPTGGDIGQVLAKASTDPYDTEWVDQTGSGGGGTNLDGGDSDTIYAGTAGIDGGDST